MGGFKMMESHVTLLDQIAKHFTEASQRCYMHANIEKNVRSKRDQLVAANVWAKAAAYIRELMTSLPAEYASEKVREEILKYHKEDDNG